MYCDIVVFSSSYLSLSLSLSSSVICFHLSHLFILFALWLSRSTLIPRKPQNGMEVAHHTLHEAGVIYGAPFSFVCLCHISLCGRASGPILNGWCSTHNSWFGIIGDKWMRWLEFRFVPIRSLSRQFACRFCILICFLGGAQFTNVEDGNKSKNKQKNKQNAVWLHQNGPE